MTFNQTYRDIRVLDLATNIAGPYAAMILGDMGADVIKVERPPAGDDTRSLPPRHDGEATVFLAVNRNKRSVVIDIKSAQGKEDLMRLVETADIVIESFPPGLADKMGLTFEDFRARNAGILVCSISAFGDGPIGRTMPGYDALVQAVSGLMSFTGHEGAPPVRIAPSVLDLTTGMWGALGLMAALARQSQGGGAEHVRPSLIDTAFNLMNHQLLAYLATGEEPRKLGSGAPSAAPYGVYQASDGALMIATASEPQFPRLCAALDLVEAGQDARFRTTAARLQNRLQLDSLIGAKIALKPVAHWLDHLGRAGISVGRVNSVAEASDLPVVQERKLWIEQESSGGVAALPQLRLPIDSGGSGPRQSPPKLGQHNSEIIHILSQSSR